MAGQMPMLSRPSFSGSITPSYPPQGWDNQQHHQQPQRQSFSLNSSGGNMDYMNHRSSFSGSIMKVTQGVLRFGSSQGLIRVPLPTLFRTLRCVRGCVRGFVRRCVRAEPKRDF